MAKEIIDTDNISAYLHREKEKEGRKR